MQHRSKEKTYVFDVAFGNEKTNKDVFMGTIAPLVGGVFNGINCTVFAYGATGSGKTFTMVGTEYDPGLMVRSLEAVFKDLNRFRSDENVDITCSYLEVYNEVRCCSQNCKTPGYEQRRTTLSIQACMCTQRKLPR